MFSLVSTSHKRAVVSLDDDASVFLSGEKATDFTVILWPTRGAPIVTPGSTFHKHTASSSDAEARVLSSGEKATEYTSPRCLSKVRGDVQMNVLIQL